MARPGQLDLGGVGVRQLGAQFREVDFLRVRGALGVFFEHHRAREVLDRFFDHVVENAHHCYGLRFVESFGFQALHEFQRIEMVGFTLGWGRGEGALCRFEA